MTGKYDYLGIAGEVLELYESTVPYDWKSPASKDPRPSVKLRAAFDAVKSHEGSIERLLGNHVVPEGTPARYIPSLETLLARGPYKNSLDSNKLTIVFNDGSGLSLFMPNIFNRDALNDFCTPGSLNTLKAPSFK
jgi:hypothetical protein